MSKILTILYIYFPRMSIDIPFVLTVVGVVSLFELLKTAVRNCEWNSQFGFFFLPFQRYWLPVVSEQNSGNVLRTTALSISASR